MSSKILSCDQSGAGKNSWSWHVFDSALMYYVTTFLTKDVFLLHSILCSRVSTKKGFCNENSKLLQQISDF